MDLNTIKEEKIRFQKPGEYLIYFFNLNGKKEFSFECEKIKANIFGLFIGNGKDEFSFSTIQNHLSKNCESNLYVKGIFKDEAKLSYKGMIKIEKKASQTISSLKNKNISLSQDTEITTKAFLEIENNEVICNHGVSTGSFSKEEISYMKNRGLNERQAQKLLIQGFTNEIFALNIKHGIEMSMNQQLRNEALKKIID